MVLGVPYERRKFELANVLTMGGGGALLAACFMMISPHEQYTRSDLWMHVCVCLCAYCVCVCVCVCLLCVCVCVCVLTVCVCVCVCVDFRLLFEIINESLCVCVCVKGRSRQF